MRELKCPRCGRPLPGVAPDEELFTGTEYVPSATSPDARARVEKMELDEGIVAAPEEGFNGQILDIDEAPEPLGTDEGNVSDVPQDITISLKGSPAKQVVEDEETIWGKMPWELGAPKKPSALHTKLRGASSFALAFYYALIASVALFLRWFISSLVPTAGLEELSDYSPTHVWLPRILLILSVLAFVASAVYTFIGVMSIANPKRQKHIGVRNQKRR